VAGRRERSDMHDTTTASAMSITVTNGLVCVAQPYLEVGWHRCWHHAEPNTAANPDNDNDDDDDSGIV